MTNEAEDRVRADAHALGRLEGRTEALEERLTRLEETTSGRLAAMDVKLDAIVGELRLAAGRSQLAAGLMTWTRWLLTGLLATAGWAIGHFQILISREH